ncbi:hypothetical protein BDN72DRAFT_865232, partial [Pluteus cervinus]
IGGADKVVTLLIHKDGARVSLARKIDGTTSNGRWKTEADEHLVRPHYKLIVSGPYKPAAVTPIEVILTVLTLILERMIAPGPRSELDSEDGYIVRFGGESSGTPRNRLFFSSHFTTNFSLSRATHGHMPLVANLWLAPHGAFDLRDRWPIWLSIGQTSITPCFARNTNAVGCRPRSLRVADGLDLFTSVEFFGRRRMIQQYMAMGNPISPLEAMYPLDQRHSPPGKTAPLYAYSNRPPMIALSPYQAVMHLVKKQGSISPSEPLWEISEPTKGVPRFLSWSGIQSYTLESAIGFRPRRMHNVRTVVQTSIVELFKDIELRRTAHSRPDMDTNKVAEWARLMLGPSDDLADMDRPFLWQSRDMVSSISALVYETSNNGKPVEIRTRLRSGDEYEPTTQPRGALMMSIVAVQHAPLFWLSGRQKRPSLTQNWGDSYNPMLHSEGEKVLMFKPRATVFKRKIDDLKESHWECITDGAEKYTNASGTMENMADEAERELQVIQPEARTVSSMTPYTTTDRYGTGDPPTLALLSQH